MDLWLSGLLIVVVFLSTGCILTAIPYLTRRTESFGISVTEEVYHNPQLRAMRKGYSIIVGVLTIVITASIFIFSRNAVDEEAFAVALSVHLLIMLVVSFGIYIRYHLRMKGMKRENGWQSPTVHSVVVDTTFHQRKIALSYMWFIPHLIVTLLTLGTILLFYEQFPDTIALKYDFAGNATNVVDKSYMALLWHVGVQLFLIVVFLISNYVITASKQQIDNTDKEGSLHRTIVFRRKWSVFLVNMGFLLVCLFYYMLLSDLLDLPAGFKVAAPLLLVAYILIHSMWLSFTVGQGGSKVKTASGTMSGGGAGPSDNDTHWKLGVFYFNPADPALFLEKRFGIGWTVNFGRPLAWLFILVLIAIVIISIATS